MFVVSTLEHQFELPDFQPDTTQNTSRTIIHVLGNYTPNIFVILCVMLQIACNPLHRQALRKWFLGSQTSNISTLDWYLEADKIGFTWPTQLTTALFQAEAQTTGFALGVTSSM